jgi:hypothetical protein
MAVTTKFIQDRLRTIRKLRNIKNTDVTWNTWIMRATAEWCLCVDWLRDMSWAAAKEATSIEIKCAKKRLTLWKREVQTQVQNTTAKAHAWSKAPQTWVPARAEHQGRGVVAHAQRLQENLDVWKQVWEHTDGAASFCEKIHDFGDEEPPPKLTPQDVRFAARTFSCKTASGTDRIRPRSMAMLSDECLTAFAEVMHQAECLGKLPEHLRNTLLPQLPKPDGGHRLIGLLPDALRVYNKARKPQQDR